MRKPFVHIALLALVLAGLSAGCEEDVNPYIGTDFPFTVWGFLNPKADTQAVRVFEIHDQLRLIDPTPIDAQMVSTNVGTGEQQVWNDSIIAVGNGDYRHVFWAPFNVDHGETHRIEISTSDGRTTRSTDITIPLPVTLEVIPPDVNDPDNVRMSIRIAGGAPSVTRIDVTYDAFSINEDGDLTADNDVTISYSNQQFAQGEDWILNIDALADYEEIEADFILKDLPRRFICTRMLSMTAHIGNEEWVSPVGLFDGDILVEPGTLTNISNGFGFFGAGFTESITWDPPDLLLIRAGFINCPLRDS